ncbi:MAG: hypothetical protein J7M30_11335 [Deltaproteobacteria bacterium]|nr:hypothetical protein [Deltaproteobacteria bacterium]
MSSAIRQYAIELDGTLYICSKDRVEQVADFRDIRGDRWLVSDFEGAVSRYMTMEAPVKYVEVMVRRNLQETGEFDEPVTVFTHWKKKKGPNTTDVFFTALPTRLYYQHLDQTKAYKDNLLLFPLYSVLFAVLRHMRQTDPVSVMFQHGRFLDMIIGTRKRVYYAGRCVAYDESDEQISSLWNMVNSDIRNTETENRIKVEKVLALTWVDSQAEPEWPEDMGCELCSLEEEAVSLNGETYSVSLPNALRMISGLEAISGTMEKAAYYSRRSLPFLNALLFLIAILFFGGYLWCDHRADLTKEDLDTVATRIAVLREEAPLVEVPYKKTLAFVRELARYRKTPALNQVINDMSEALAEGMTVDMVKADYGRDGVNIQALTKIEAPFDVAYRGYRWFMSAMRQKGYDVGESEFNTTIQESRFLIRLKKSIR